MHLVTETTVRRWHGILAFQHQNPSINRSLIETKLIKLETKLRNKKEKHESIEQAHKKWLAEVADWWESNDIDSITEDNVESWKEKQNCLKRKAQEESKSKERIKKIKETESEIEELKKYLYPH